MEVSARRIQTCADLSSMISNDETASVPAACRIPDMKGNCPISCMHELNPMCYDGTPALPKQIGMFSELGSR